MTKIIVSVIIIWLLITIIVMLYSNSKKIESINKKIDDLDTIITKIMKPAIEWYCNYRENEDSNMKK